MSKEELERASAQGQSSSVPPRSTSDAPGSLPSTPPSTEEIDTDWGADDSSEVTRVMLQPMLLPATALSAPPEPASPTASVAPVEPPTPDPTTSPTASVDAPEPNAERAGSVRPMRARSQTLIGLLPPTAQAPLAQDATPLPLEKRESAPPPMPSAAFSEPVRAPSAPPPPVARPSAPPPPLAAPSTPPPPAAPSTPPPPAALSTPPLAAPSKPPAPVEKPSVPPAAGSSSSTARSSVPAPRVSSPPANAVVARPQAAHQSGFGRWLLVLAAGLAVVSVLGYRVVNRSRAALTAASGTNTLSEPAATVTATATALSEPAPAVSAAQPTPAASAVEPAPGTSPAASASPVPATSPAASAPVPSASTATEAASDSGIRQVTIKSSPKKVRFYHFGKLVGVAPFVLEFKPGERHAYEAGLPGYGTRKVVIDGSKPQITVGLTREKP